MRTAQEGGSGFRGRLGACCAVAVCVTACSIESGAPSTEVPECQVSIAALAQEVGLEPALATVHDVHARLDNRAARTESAHDRQTLRVVEEAYFRQLGLEPERWFSPLALADPACGAPSAPQALTTRCDQDADTFKVALGGCQRLLASHVPADLARDLYGECIGRLRAAQDLIVGTECEAGASRAVGQVAGAVMTKAITAGHDYAAVTASLRAAQNRDRSAPSVRAIDEDDPRFPDIQRRLGIVNQWLEFMLELGLPIDQLPSSLSDVWLDAYAVPPDDQPYPEAVLEFLDQMDQFLVIEGLQDPDYLPLIRLNIEAIALARIAKEVESRADLVHVLCSLGNCGVSIAVKDVTQAMAALMDDDVSFPPGTALGERASAWLDTLGAAHVQRERFRSAIEAIPEDSNALFLRDLIDRLRLKLQRLESDPSERYPLATRLHDENRQAIRAEFTGARNELSLSLELYKQARVAYAQSQIAALGQQANELGLGAELIRSLEVLADSETKAADLRELYDDAQLRWAALGDFVTRVEKLGLRGEVILSPGESHQVSLPDSATFTAEDGEATPENIAGKSVHSWTLAKGDTLRFTVRNKWSPTCSLRSADYHENVVLAAIDTSYSETGPEGYYLQYSQSNFRAQSATNNNSVPTPAGACRAIANVAGSIGGAGIAGAEAGAGLAMAPGFWPGLGDLFRGAGLFLNDCALGLFGAGSSRGTSRSRGRESRWSAAFSGGLRLDNTPFPTLPAGSLVLAVVSGGEIVDAYVVHSSAAIQMPAAGEAYLVVNDINCAESSGTLLVDWAHGESMEGRAKQLAQAMADVATKARTDLDQIADVGLFTQADADAFRSSARQMLFESCGHCEVESVFPPGVMGMFDEWMSHEIAQMQRKVDLRRLAFETRLLALTIESLSGQLALEQGGGRWTEYIKQLAFTELSDVSLGRLENALGFATEFLDQRILPVVQVRYPQVLTAVRQLSVESVADLDLSIDTLATDFSEVVLALDSELGTASTGPYQEDKTPVLLWIPKPGAPRDFGNGAVRVLVADADDIANVWQEAPDGTIELADNARIRVAAAELYSPDAGIVDRLGCRRSAAVIDRAMLYAIDEASPYVGQPFDDPMNINRFAVDVVLANPLFVTDGGRQSYDLVAGDAGELRVARGTFSDRGVVSNELLPEETSLRGLAPFLDIRLEGADPLNEMLTDASGLALIIRVSSYVAGSGVWHCD